MRDLPATRLYGSMASIRLSNSEIWTAAAWVFDFLERSCATILGPEHELSLALDRSAIDGTHEIDLRSMKAPAFSDLEAVIQSISAEAAVATGPSGFHDVDHAFQAGLLDRVKELQALLSASL